jgi:1-acyl-sn-glycerol-3-phosphate acyltransferase
VVAESLGRPVGSLDPGLDLFDQGLDSLGILALCDLVEARLGLRIAPDRFLEPVTIVQLCAEGGRPLPTAGPAARAEQRSSLYAWLRARRALDGPLDLLYRLAATSTTVLGAERLSGLPPRVVLASSHRSHPDFLAIRAALASTPARQRARGLLSIAGVEGLVEYTGRWAPLIAACCDLLTIRQRADATASIAALAASIGPSAAVLIHPQGSHCTVAEEQAGEPGAMFRPGVALLALALRAPVVPCGLAGTEHLLPPRVPDEPGGPYLYSAVRRIRPAPVVVAFGAPLWNEPGEAPIAFTGRVQAACFALNRTAEATRTNYLPPPR